MVYEAAFTEIDHYFHQGYLTTQQAENDAAEALALLGISPGARILDAGCGDGRLAVRLAALGFRVTGVDRDAAQLERAQAAADQSGMTLTFVNAPLEEMGDIGIFDAALLWFTTWGFSDDSSNARVLRSIASCLVPGGSLALDTLNPIGVQSYLSKHPAPVVTQQGEDEQIDAYSFDLVSSRLWTNRTVRKDGVESTRILKLSLPTIPQWEQVLKEAGLILDSVHGKEGSEFTPDSWGMVLVARAL